MLFVTLHYIANLHYITFHDLKARVDSAVLFYNISTLGIYITLQLVEGPTLAACVNVRAEDRGSTPGADKFDTTGYHPFGVGEM